MKFISYTKFKKESLKNKKVKAAYDALEPEYKLIESIIEKRLKEGLTQKQLAKKIGTKQPVISRLEGGSYNPSIKFLNRVAKALNAKVKVTIY